MSFFHIGQAADQGWFVLFDTNGCASVRLGNDGNAVHTGAGGGQGPDFELEDQSKLHCWVMKGGRRFYLHAKIDIFRSRVGRLRHTGGGGVGKIRGILNHRYLTLSGQPDPGTPKQRPAIRW